MKSENTIIVTNESVKHLKYPVFDNIPFLIHGASTRYGGVSEIPYFSSMNLGLSTDDDISLIKKNWEIFCNALNVDINNTVCADQKHGDRILNVTEKDRGKGIIFDRDYENYDGLITNCKDVALCIFSADCIPVLFVDTDKKVIGAAHCGWKGTFLDLAEKMVNKMVAEYNCNVKDIKVAIGAGIHSCCYEVDKDLFIRFSEKYGNVNCTQRYDKYYLDLPMINKQIIEKTGVKDIFVSDLCTCCNKNVLFSHRGSNGKRGLMVNLIQIK